MKELDKFYRRLALIFAGVGIVWLLFSLTLFIFFAPLQLEIVGIKLSLTSLVRPLRIALLLLLGGLLFRYLYRRNTNPGLTINQFFGDLAARAASRFHFFKQYQGFFLGGILLLLTIYLVGYKVRQHRTYDTNSYDLTLYDQAFSNTLRGDFLKAWGIDRNYFSEHFSPFILLLLPGYRCWPGPVFLLVVQGVMAAAGAVALFLLARQFGLPRLLAGLSGLIFIFHPGFWEGFRFDFHQEIIFPAFFFLAVYFLSRKKMGRFYLICLGALTIKEDISLYLFLFSFWVVIRYSPKWGIILMGTSLLWGFVAFYYLIPAFSPQATSTSHFVARYHHYGETYSQILRGILKNAPALFSKSFLVSFRSLLPPLGYLPRLSPVWLSLGIMAATLNVSSSFDYQAVLGAYYGLPALTFFMVGFLQVEARLWRRAAGYKFAALLLICYCLTSIQLHPWRRIRPADRQATEWLEGISLVGKQVSASNVLIPHLKRADQVSLFPEGGDPDLILLYFRPGKFNSWPLTPARFLGKTIRLLQQGNWRVKAFNGSTLFLEEGPAAPSAARPVIRFLREKAREEN